MGEKGSTGSGPAKGSGVKATGVKTAPSGKSKDNDAKKKIGDKPGEKDETSKVDAKDAKPKPKAPSEAWKNSLVESRGQIAACQSNLNSIFTNEPAWKGVIAYNEFTEQIVKLKDPPWHDDDRPAGKLTGPWSDGDSVCAAAWVTREWEDIKPSDLMVEKAIRNIAKKNPIHPVRDWLKSLKWDGKARLDMWLVDVAGAEETLYARAVGAMFVISAVARAFEPGCKVDHTIVLEGDQGIGKSSLIRELVGEEWFLETGIELGSKDSYQVLHGKWIVELAELDSLNRSELTRVKNFLTARIDSYRPSYGRTRMDFPRQCVFAGTTNEEVYLKDDTGGRRFWPIKCTKVNLQLLREIRDQIWAEAVARYQAGEKWHVTDKKLIGLFEDEQEFRRQHDGWQRLVHEWLIEHPRRWEGVGTEDILERAIDYPKKDQHGFEAVRVGKILRKLGWERVRGRIGGDRHYVYKPTPAALAELKAESDRRDAATKQESDGKVRNLAEKLKNPEKNPTKSKTPGKTKPRGNAEVDDDE